MSYKCPERHEAFDTTKQINRGWNFLAETDGKAARDVERCAAVKCTPVWQIHTGHNAGKWKLRSGLGQRFCNKQSDAK